MGQSSDVFLRVQMTLKEIVEKLTELSKEDLTNIHVNQEWSWIPYVKDHLDFLIEQTGGVGDALRDAPPPVTPEDLARHTSKDQS
jgi:hypothetical protein